MNKRTILILIISLFLSSAAFPLRAGAETTTVYVDPQRITGLDVGQTFRIYVKVANVSDLAAWEFRLYYKSSVLNASDIYRGSPFLESHPDPNKQVTWGVNQWTDTYNSTHGLVLAYALLYNVPNVPKGVSGSGTLTWIEFKAKGSGDSPLDLTHVFPTPIYIISDSNAQPIPHTTIDGIVHVGLRDVAITNIEAPKNIEKDAMAHINVTAENQGVHTETFDVTLFYDDNLIEAKTLFSMPGGNITILYFHWDTTPIPIGEYVIRAEATIVTGEVDTADNTYTYGTIYVGIRDIAITNTKPSKTVTNDTTVYINVTVSNNGEPGTPPQTFHITVYHNVTPIETQTVTNLTAGSTETLTFTWYTITVPKGKYVIRAEATTVPGETITVDNIYTDGWVTETILGDLDGDYEVKIKDIAMVARAFGSKPGDPSWEPNADINNDGEIKIYDVATVARQFGKKAL